jgi:hypothetical protein
VSRYDWRVCAENTSGHCGAWSAAWWFATAGPASLAAPVLLAPDPDDPTPVSVQRIRPVNYPLQFFQ